MHYVDPFLFKVRKSYEVKNEVVDPIRVQTKWKKNRNEVKSEKKFQLVVLKS